LYLPFRGVQGDHKELPLHNYSPIQQCWALFDMTFSPQQVEDHLRDRVAPIANRLDDSEPTLKQAFLELGQQGWLGLKITTEWGGGGISSTEFQQFQEMLARYSGALAFLQSQHQSAGSFLSRSCNEFLKRQYLPHMSTGKLGVGVGFSHLRRSPPPLKALPIEDGYLLNGTIPWITGFDMFQAFVGAAVLPDGRAVYGMLPLSNTQFGEGYIQFSDPLPLAAMRATNTVTAELHQWFLVQDQVLFVNEADAIQASDRQNVLQHSFYALGCARAGLDIVEQAAQAKSQDWLQDVYLHLNQTLRGCRAAIYTAEERSFEERLQLRVKAIELAIQCAHAAVIVFAGGANSLEHPAQRIYREAMVFSVTGQTPAVMQATLRNLISSVNF